MADKKPKQMYITSLDRAFRHTEQSSVKSVRDEHDFTEEIEQKLSVQRSVCDALKSLPKLTRDILILRTSGLKYAEIAKRLNKSEDAIRQRYSDGRRRAREYMENNVPDIGSEASSVTGEIRDIINNVKRLREISGLSQQELAIRTEISRRHLNFVENGRAELSEDLHRKIKNVALAQLIYESRIIMLEKDRIFDAFEVAEKLKRITDIGRLYIDKIGVITLRIDDSDEEPIILPVTWGLFVREPFYSPDVQRVLSEYGVHAQPENNLTNVDLVIVNEYRLEDLIGAKLNNEKIELPNHDWLDKYIS